MKNEKLYPSYLVARLACLWQEEGHRVTVGPSDLLEADIGMINIDRTWVPAGCIPANPEGRPILNASILDISKKRISGNILTFDSSYKGKVIIKTDANSFAWPERSSGTNGMAKSLYRMSRHFLPWNLTRQLWFYQDYPILNDLNGVPEWVWKREDLIVERFVPEMEGEEYALRLWVFFGDQEYGVRMFSPDPVVKVSGITRFENIDGVPESLRKIRQELEMDFGKFDYVVVDGKAILLDVNKTPTGRIKKPPSDNLRKLASGLDQYLAGI